MEEHLNLLATPQEDLEEIKDSLSCQRPWSATSEQCREGRNASSIFIPSRSWVQDVMVPVALLYLVILNTLAVLYFLAGDHQITPPVEHWSTSKSLMLIRVPTNQSGNEAPAADAIQWTTQSELAADHHRWSPYWGKHSQVQFQAWQKLIERK